MKIGIIGPAHPYRGGIADTNEAFCRALNKIGHEASLITFTLQYPNFLFPGKTQFSEESEPNDLDIKRLINSTNPISWSKTAKYINQAKFDLVIFRFWLPFMGLAFGQISKRINKSIIQISLCDNVLPHEPRIGDKSLTTFFLNKMDGFVTMSKKVQIELKDFSSKNTLCIPHPINEQFGSILDQATARAKLGLEAEGKYLLFFGLIRKYKGLDLILKALADKSLEKLKVRLIIAGEFYEPKEKYLELIETLNLQDRVIIKDHFVPSDEIKYYFSAVDLVTQTYHSASQSGVTPIALNFECPMLVTNVGGLAEVVIDGKNGYVTTKEPAMIASKILDFYTQEKASEFKQSIKEEKWKYSWTSFGEQVISFAKELKA